MPILAKGYTIFNIYGIPDANDDGLAECGSGSALLGRPRAYSVLMPASRTMRP